MAVSYTYTIANGTPLDADEVMQNFTDAKTVADTAVQNTGAETIAGNKTFSGTVIVGAHVQFAEISAPTNVANKGLLYAKDDSGDTELYYKDDSGNEVQITRDGAVIGSVTTTTGADTSLENSEKLIITHASDSSYKRGFEFYKYETDHWEIIVDDDSNWNVELYDTTTELTNIAAGTTNVKGVVMVYS